MDYSIDKIIVTCGIDHIPPPLLSQLRPNGIMMIPVCPPGQHVLLKVMKQQAHDGSIRVANVSNKVVPFVAFTKPDGEAVRDTHDGGRKVDAWWRTLTRPNILPRVEVLGLATQSQLAQIA